MKSPINSRELLHRYTRDGDEDAFAEIVKRHLNVVYSVALRKLGGDRSLAEDCAQRVFVDLGQKGSKLRSDAEPAAWLYRHTMFTASKMVDSERRRQTRERSAAEITELSTGGESASWQLIQVIDEAMTRLSDRDRTVIVQRFLHGLSLRELGQMLGTSEDAARKRVTRALDKMRGILSRQGVALSLTALGAILSNDIASAAPATDLAPDIIASSRSEVAIIWSPLKAFLIGGSTAVLFGGSVLVFQERAISQLRSELAEVAATIPSYSTVRPNSILPIRVTTQGGRLSVVEIINRLVEISKEPRNVVNSAALKVIVGGIHPNDMLKVARLGEEQLDPVTFQRLRLAMFGKWALQRPEEAFTEGVAWIRELPSYLDKVQSDFQAWADRDPDKAAEWFLNEFQVEQTDGSRSIDHSSPRALRLAHVFSKTAPEVGARLAEQFPPGFPRRARLFTSFRGWFGKDPTAAFAWASQLESAGERFDQAFIMMKTERHEELVGEKWEGPNDVITWALSKTPTDQRAEALAEVLGYWGGMGSVDEGAEWLMDQPVGIDMDPANKALATMKRQDSATAMAIAGRLTDPSERAALLGGVFRRWLQKRPDQATEYLETSKMPDAQRSRLQAIVENQSFSP